MLGLISILTILAISGFMGLFRPKLLLYFYAASLPFYGVIAEVGLQVSPYLVVAMVMAALLVYRLETIRIPVVLAVFLLYAIGATILMSVFLPDTIHAFPLFRGKLRWLSQVIVLFLLFMPLVFAMQFRLSESDVRRMMGIFLASTAVLCVTGVWQMIWFYRTGVDLFPINLFSGVQREEDLRSGMTRISEDFKTLRMSGLGGGEPKNFGYTCAVAFIINLMAGLFGLRQGKRGVALGFLYAALFGAGILLSLSTQAYLVIGLYIIVLLLAMMLRFGLLNRKTLALSVGLVTLAIALWSSDFSRRLIELRIYERIVETGAIEDFNQTISRFLLSNPEFLIFGTGLGNVHFWAVEYIPREFAYYMKDNVFVAKAGFLRLVSEVGIVGLLSFVALFVFPFFRLRRHLKGTNPRYCFMVLLIAIMVFLSFMVTADASPYYVFVLILLFATMDDLLRRDNPATA